MQHEPPAIIFCGLTGKMKVVHGDEIAIRDEADKWQRSTPEHPVYVLTPTYTTGVQHNAK
ncbi:MAG: hypothetical protein AB7J28_16810 [Hyphomonadaceae bacterium]